MSVRAGIALASWPMYDGPQPLWDVIDRAEALGIDSLWFIDRVVGRSPAVPEPVVLMAAVAARTQRIKFGPSVFALGVRHPVLLAKELATLDVISGGRVLPAVGLGADDPVEAEAMGITARERARRTDEAIEVMRLLWTEETVTYEGRYYRLHGASVWPRPVQKPCPPVWIGGKSEAALRRVARLGDGWLASRVSPREVEASVAAIWRYLDETGREIEEDHIGVIVPVYLAADEGRALEVAGPRLLRARPDTPPLEEYTALGPPQRCLALLRRFREAGASKFVLLMVCPPEEALAQLELLAREVIHPLEAERATPCPDAPGG
jgi:probable F420-dependent oxidoreductase